MPDLKADITEYGLAGFSMTAEILVTLVNKNLLSIIEARAILTRAISTVPTHMQAGVRNALLIKLSALEPF